MQHTAWGVRRCLYCKWWLLMTALLQQLFEVFCNSRRARSTTYGSNVLDVHSRACRFVSPPGYRLTQSSVFLSLIVGLVSRSTSNSRLTPSKSLMYPLYKIIFQFHLTAWSNGSSNSDLSSLKIYSFLFMQLQLVLKFPMYCRVVESIGIWKYIHSREYRRGNMRMCWRE